MNLLRRLSLIPLLLVLFGLLAPTAGALDIEGVGDIDTLASVGNGFYGSDVDAQGNLYVAYFPGHQVHKVTPDGTVTVFAGTGVSGYSGDDGDATSAQLALPQDVAYFGGNLYIADRGNHVIRMVDSSGDITTVAGTGAAGYSGDDGPATSAQLNTPNGIGIDGSGNLYIGDSGNGVIRKVTAGTITTLASAPYGAMDVDASGNVYAADLFGDYVIKIDSLGNDTPFAGSGTSGYSGDGGPAVDADLDGPYAVGVDGDGNVFIATIDDHRVRMVDTAGDISTVAGNGTAGYTGDGGPATSAQLYSPTGLGLDAAGNLFITDYSNGVIRVVAFADSDGDSFPDLIDNFPDVYSRCRTSQATIIGNDNANALDGTSGPDVIMGFGGADIINGNGGDDLICAGNGADTITGGDGKDRIYAENGTDTVYGNEKSDRIYGGNGNDTLYGNGGTRDRLFGGDGTDTLNGGTGTDDRCTLGETYANCEVIF
jgi:hypothetical protein